MQIIAALTGTGAGAGVLFPSQSLAFTKLIARIIQTEINTKYAVPPPIPGAKSGMAIDLGLCIGCRRCSYACKRENSVPDTISPPYIMLMEIDPITLRRGSSILDEHGNGLKNRLMYTKLRKDKEYMPLQCNHCEAPPCAKVCPTKATYKDKDGIVMIDYDKCIGCRYCMVACPFSVPRFEWDEVLPRVTKCTFCSDRLAAGDGPACAEACPVGAIIWGTRGKLLAEAKQRLADNPGEYEDYIYGEKDGGGTSVLYLSHVPFDKLGFPELDSEPVSDLSEEAGVAILPTLFVGAPLIMAGAYYLASKRIQED